MNYYILVEGIRTEALIYPQWIKYKFPHLNEVMFPSQLQSNNFCIVSGDGYPAYLDKITKSIDDILSQRIDCRFIVAVDSEEFTAQSVRAEVIAKISAHPNSSRIDYRVIVQQFSIEAWALGNDVIFKRNPTDSELLKYIARYNVNIDDPEKIPAGNHFNFNTRAQFATSYLKKIFNERNISYSKNSPGEVGKSHYYDQIEQRNTNTGHVSTFRDFYNAFI